MTRVLITGGCGFIGRHVAQELQQHGHEVRVYDALIEQVHEGAAALPDDVDFIRGDMRDADSLRGALKGCDAVLHLAAEVGVGQSMYEIARYVGANDLGTAVLLEALLDHPVERIVVASSMSVYGEGAMPPPRARRSIPPDAMPRRCAAGAGTFRGRTASPCRRCRRMRRNPSILPRSMR